MIALWFVLSAVFFATAWCYAFGPLKDFGSAGYRSFMIGINAMMGCLDLMIGVSAL